MGCTVLPLLCVLYTLTATGHALFCKVCLASYSTYCNGASMICPEGHVCASTYSRTTVDGSTVSDEFSMLCVPRNQCGTQGSTSVPHSKQSRGTSCCYTDNCTPAMPILPEDDNRYNGVTCHTCVSADSDWCYTEDTMRCRGKENMCLLQTIHHYSPIEKSIAVRGCATKSLCDLGTQTVSYGKLNITIKLMCASRSSSLHGPLFLPIIVTLVAIQMFYF